MFENLLLNEIILSTLWVIAMIICLEFIKAKNGQLRKIMIAYFFTEFILYLSSAVYFLAIHFKWFYLSPDVYRVSVLLPKMAIKIWFLIWLKRGNFKKYSNN